jgi:fumarate reductase subunit C
MNMEAQYSLHHPRWYRRRVSVWWWLEKWTYAKFVLRELTSLSVAYFSVLCLWKVRALRAGPGAYDRFLQRMASPIFILVNCLALCFVLFHALTWFNLAPKAMVMRWAGKRVPDWAVQGMNYLAWMLLSAVVVWMVTRG